MSVISSGTTLTTALVQTGDTNGNLVFKTGASGTTALTLGSDQSATFAGAVSFSGGAFAAGSAGAPSITFTGDTNTGIFSPAADTIAFTEGGVESMRIDSSGNVGIGTSSPVSIAGYTIQTLNNGTSGSGTYYQQAATSIGRVLVTSTEMYVGSNGAYPLILTTNAAERMRIDSSGNVGIGTSSPNEKLEVVGSAGGGTSNSPSGTVILRRNGGPNAGDYGPAITFAQYFWTGSTTLIGTGQISGVKTEGNGNFGGGLAFFSCPSGSGSFSERMRLDAAGNLLVGTTSQLAGSASGTFHLVGGANSNTIGNTYLRNPNSSSGKYWNVGPVNNNGYVVYNQGGVGVYITDGGTSWTANSDERLKTVLTPFENAVEKVSSLRAGTGRYLTDDEFVSRSFLIAQDVQSVLPEAVDVQPDEQGTLGLRYQDLIPLLVAAIKEQQAIITDQASTIAAFEARLTALEGTK